MCCCFLGGCFVVASFVFLVGWLLFLLLFFVRFVVGFFVLYFWLVGDCRFVVRFVVVRCVSFRLFFLLLFAAGEGEGVV